jgi:hypothetical protein
MSALPLSNSTNSTPNSSTPNSNRLRVKTPALFLWAALLKDLAPTIWVSSFLLDIPFLLDSSFPLDSALEIVPLATPSNTLEIPMVLLTLVPPMVLLTLVPPTVLLTLVAPMELSLAILAILLTILLLDILKLEPLPNNRACERCTSHWTEFPRFSPRTLVPEWLATFPPTKSLLALLECKLLTNFGLG